MFGGGATWGQQNNQQQQQPQQGGLFGGGGTAGGFGQTNNAFGQPNTGGFGQPAQQQQQAPQQQGGGLFGSATPSAGFGTGGGFGSNTQTTNNAFGARPTFGATGTSTFGAQNNTGGGLFGSAPKPATTFGNTSGGLFGSQQPATSGFGTGQTSTLFGANSGTPAFGAANAGNPNQVNQYNPGPYGPAPQNGSAAPAYYPSWQQDPSTSTVGASSGPPHLFNHISAMDPYKGASPEELRAVDYQQNRKTAGTAAAGGFGQPAATSTFGQPAQTTNAFGAPQTNAFGAPKPGGLFGSTAPATSGFGQTASGFGTNPSNATGGLFGQPQQQQQQQQQQTGGLFGSTPANTTGTTGGLFGQSQQQQNPASTGLFGNSNPFGGQQQNQQQGSTFGSGFGATQNKPGFGATGSTGFGQTAATGTNTGGGLFGGGANNGTFSFGQNNQQQQQQGQQQAGGLFGGSTLGQPQQNTGTSLFGGSNQQQAQPAAGGGLFGANNTAKPGGLFGSTTGTTAPSSSFSFGQNNQQQQPAAGTSLFGGANNATQPAAGGGLFGSTQPQQGAQQPGQTSGLFGANNTGSSLFGAKPATTGTTGGGLFGSTTQQPAAGQAGGLFGAPAAGAGTGLFRGGNSTGFGANQQQNQQKPGGLFGGGSLFGNNQSQPAAPAATGGGLFGGNLGQSQNSGTGLFGGTNQQPAQQPALGGSLFGGGLNQSQAQNQQQTTLTASMADFPYGNSDLFKWNGQTLGLSPSTKKPALPPMTSSFRVTPKSSVNKLRGFSSPLQASLTPSRRAQSPLATPGMGTSRYAGLTDADLGPNAFVPRPNIKKLTVTPKTNGIADGEDKLESVLGKSLLKRDTPKTNGSAEMPPSASKPHNGTATNGNLFASTNGSPMTHTPSRAPATLNRSLMQSTSDRQPKKGEYWCRPRPEKLKMLSERDLKELPHFTAGRRGFGEVTWLEPVDLTDVDLNEFLGSVIVFTEMELAVYPDDYASSKPQQGQGLNQPARITLENCWPKDKATKQPVTDLNDPRHQRFLKRVKNIPGTEFVGYTDEGTWTFEVGHFSRWGVGSESDDEDADQSPAALKKREATRSSALDRTPSHTPESGSDDDDDFLPPTKGLRDDESAASYETGLDEEEDGSLDSVDHDADRTTSSHDTSGSAVSRGAQSPSFDEVEPSPTVPVWEDALQRNLGTSGLAKLREMRRGFGSFAPETQTPARRPGTLDPDSGLGRLISKQMEAEAEYASAKRQREAHNGQDFGSAEEEQAVDTRAIKRASFGENNQTKQPSASGVADKGSNRGEEPGVGGLQPEETAKLRQPRKYRRVLSHDKGAVDAASEGLRADAGLALGRSWRATWGPNGELVHLGSICGPNAIISPSTDAAVYIEDVRSLAEDHLFENIRAKRLVELHLDRSIIIADNGVPFAAIDPELRFHDFARLFDAGDRSHEAKIWRLGTALFDEIDLRLPPTADDDLTERVSGIRRKLALSKWLEQAVAPTVDSELLATLTDHPAKIFSLLSGNQIERAVQAAIDGKDLRLATLISQIGGPVEFKEQVMRQLEDWKKYKVNPHLSTGYRRLYALLAGVMDVSPGEKGPGGCADVIVAQGLDWKRAFGLRFWFGSPFEDSISDVLDSYRSALGDSPAPARPLPPYLESPSTASESKTWTMSTEPTDILYNLIRLYADTTISLDQTLDARSCSPSPFDQRLPWHMYVLLSRIMGKRDFEDRDDGYSVTGDRLTQGYARQLEETGQWTWAAFLLLHLETAEGREAGLKGLLHRHPNPTTTEQNFLTAHLKISTTWIDEARAAHYASNGDVWQEYHALIRAELFDRAHRILLQKLAPEAVLRGDLQLLRRMCAHLEDTGVAGWEFGGKLFLDYADLLEHARDLLATVIRAGDDADPFETARLAKLASMLPRALQLLPALFPDKGDVQQVAVLSDMLSDLHDLTSAFHQAGYLDKPGATVGSTGALVDVDRLHLLQERALGDFEKALQGVAAA